VILSFLIILLPHLVGRFEMPAYLNKLKLLIIPSSSEGVPTILLEAMTCGTPALATPVGGIPDILKDGENGFILPDNSPRSIVQGIIRALGHPRLSEIAENAQKLLAEENGEIKKLPLKLQRKVIHLKK